MRMLEAGANHKGIRSRLDFLPPGSTRAYIAQAMGNISKRRIAKALDAISEGATVVQAAASYKLKPETLKQIVAGKKGKWGKSRSDEVQLGVEIKAYISRVLFSANAGISKKIQDILLRVSEGEISVKIAEDVIKAWKKHLSHTTLRISDWESRLLAVVAEQAKIPGETKSTTDNSISA